mmetsp:Transcript_132123/g.263659  ORF Transcript_132123/g.263659 Transcript_132123/m.263659 type:complete len:428 (+) Transcript_132123:60-1343(+)
MPSKVAQVAAVGAGAYVGLSTLGSAFVAPVTKPLPDAKVQISSLRGSDSATAPNATSRSTAATAVCGILGAAVAGVSVKRRSSCRGPTQNAAVSRRGRTVAMAATGHAVIMQNKGGGHGEIGYHLAKALQAKGLKVTMLQDSAAKKSKVPYSLYDADLKDATIEWIDPEDTQAYADAAMAAVKDGPPVTHVFDNYSKKPGQIAPLLALTSSPDFKMYTFISSAGMYTSKGELSEDLPIKDPPTGQREVELKLDAALPKKWCSFRPQYIYGPHTNKRGYLDWFLERAVRGLPLPVPGDASQPVNVAHCEDVASLLSSVVGKEDAAGGEVFNCGTSSNVTYKELCDAAGKAVGKDAEIVAIPAGTKTSFPFRPNQEGFYVNVNKAKEKLGWEGAKYNVLDDISAEGFYTKDFVSLGLDKGDIDTSKDGI